MTRAQARQERCSIVNGCGALRTAAARATCTTGNSNNPLFSLVPPPLLASHLHPLILDLVADKQSPAQCPCGHSRHETSTLSACFMLIVRMRPCTRRTRPLQVADSHALLCVPQDETSTQCSFHTSMCLQAAAHTCAPTYTHKHTHVPLVLSCAVDFGPLHPHFRLDHLYSIPPPSCAPPGV
jgi:hypothetical protein